MYVDIFSFLLNALNAQKMASGLKLHLSNAPRGAVNRCVNGHADVYSSFVNFVI